VQFDWEFRRVLEYYAKKKFQRVLEIGVDTGGTLYQWMKHSFVHRPVICAVDAVEWPGCSGAGTGGKVHDWQKWADTFDVEFYPVIGDSHDLNIVDEVRSHGPYNWIFIDGDHKYEGVKADFENYYPMLAVNGVMVFHDIVEHTSNPTVSVHRLWNELKERYPLRYVEFISSPDQSMCGIGILFGNPEAV